MVVVPRRWGHKSPAGLGFDLSIHALRGFEAAYIDYEKSDGVIVTTRYRLLTTSRRLLGTHNKVAL